MIPQTTTPPAGSRRSNRLGPRRGGIQKRSRESSYTDKETEMDIDTVGNVTGRGRRDALRGRASQRARGGAGSSHTTKTVGSTRTSLNVSAIQKAIIRGLGSEDAIRSLRQGQKTTRLFGNHLGKDKDAAPKGLVQLTVRGFKDSKAASNSDGGIKDLLVFLERKASADVSVREPVKIKKVCLTV